MVWSVISFVVLLAGVGAMVWYFAAQRRKEGEEPFEVPPTDPLLALQATPSMKATLKYFWVVAALIVAQVGLGAVTAHYGVEGDGFYGIPLGKWLPYSVTRTWHTQLGIFWIATAWLATGLFVAPAVSGLRAASCQRLGVNFLFVCLLIIVVGSLAGEWLGVQQKLGLGDELLVRPPGLRVRRSGPVLADLPVRRPVRLAVPDGPRPVAGVQATRARNRHLLALFLVASAAIALFYGAGLMWGRQTNLAMAEYWRWWVVHLWVEGFFEVFATVVIAFLFTRMGLLRIAQRHHGRALLDRHLPVRRHHRHVPSSLLHRHADRGAGPGRDLQRPGDRAAGADRLRGLREPDARAGPARGSRPTSGRSTSSWRWRSGTWSGPGLFGFLINPPIALYYMQGLNTTPVHGHTALFGVYGMLGIGLMLFCLRGLTPHAGLENRRALVHASGRSTSAWR